MSSVEGVEVLAPPPGLEREHHLIFPNEAVQFIADCYRTFRQDVTVLYAARARRRLELCKSGAAATLAVRAPADCDWTVSAVPAGLADRRLDLGDVSPADLSQLTKALSTNCVSGIQVDFDDGFCPSWRNLLLGWTHVRGACLSQLPEAPPLEAAPLLMLRPRAWNMTEYHLLVDGEPTPGPLVDFCVLMYHCGARLVECGRGPALYLSKLQTAKEAALWDRIFTWTEQKLRMNTGTIRACVLIEDIQAAFEAEQILYELRRHSLGLNCGIWDYAASIISAFAYDPKFVFPDRGPHITMRAEFMTHYMRHVIDVCRRHGAPVTAGMAPHVLPDDPEARSWLVSSVRAAKRAEIEAGVNGFLVYDPTLAPSLMELWSEDVYSQVAAPDLTRLLVLPPGDATVAGLRQNLTVSLLFVHAWLGGRGHFVHRGQVEDSATAEISRSQLWQWCRHRTWLADVGKPVTLGLVLREMRTTAEQLKDAGVDVSGAVPILSSVTRSREFVPFLTTHLSQLSAIQDAS